MGKKWNKEYKSRVFWQWRKGKGVKSKYRWHGQPYGKEWFYHYPKAIAKWLGLDNPDSYTGHCIPRTGATLYSDQGATPMQLKQYGAWKSIEVATLYHAKSAKNKVQTSQVIDDAIYGHMHDNKLCFYVFSCPFSQCF